MTSDAAQEPFDLVEVAVFPPIPGKDTLTYRVEDVAGGGVELGARVRAPLGRRRVTGIVVARWQSGSVPGRVRPILDVLDEETFLPRDVVELCAFAARYYQTGIGDALAAALPPGATHSTRRWARRTPNAHAIPLTRATDRNVFEAIPADGGIPVASLQKRLGKSRVDAALRRLESDGRIRIDDEEAPAAATTKRVLAFRIGHVPTDEERAELRKRAPVQAQILDAVERAEGGSLTRSAAISIGGPSSLSSLQKKGWLRPSFEEVYREAPAPLEAPPRPAALTSKQEEVLREVEARDDFAPFLLHGITGSGKTEVYLRAAEIVRERGRGVLFLVPEIALTPAFVGQVMSRFGREISVLHSGLSPGERWDEWRRLRRGETRIAVGVRSAVFAPVRDLGLVVVDEEHDTAWKQEDGLLYNARDLALVRARDSACPIILGSATPSMESYARAREGKYRLVELPGRIDDRPLPEIEVVDLRTVESEDGPPVLSPRLESAIEETLSHRQQALLFLNRRGFARSLLCSLCGYACACPNCSVTLTFHRGVREIRCHHCDHREPAPEACPECGHPGVCDLGVGTERLEEIVRARYPGARVGRLDRDTTRRRGELRSLLAAWRAHDIDILIGTQMVVKGHDVPNVTLVGVVFADQMLDFPDFRASERAFQTILQVAGRAGRGVHPGRVVLQTYRPDHAAILRAVGHDFAAFAEAELEMREALRYPPYSRLVNVRFDGIHQDDVEREAVRSTDRLRAVVRRLGGSPDEQVLGPAPAPLERLRSRWRWHAMFKGRSVREVREVLEGAFPPERRPRSPVRLVVDVDPGSTL